MNGCRYPERVRNEIIFDPITWDKRAIVLQTNVAPIITGSSRIARKLQRLRTRPVKLRFEFNQDVSVSGQDLALALSTLCGKEFDNVRFGFNVPTATKHEIENWTHAHVDVEGAEVAQKRILSGATLNFSGGFDSLAAHYMLPAQHSLVSLAFGGRFSREKKFFKQFSPIEIDTNVAQTSLRKNSWSFIGLGSLLAMSVAQSKYCTFGSIIESTGLKRNTAHEKGLTFPPFASAGMTSAPTTQGISEVGTALVIAEHAPEHLADSLKSLASPYEEKLFRKWVLAKTALQYFGKHVPLSQVVRPQVPHYRFGERFVVDLTAMMVASIGNEDLARQLVRGLDSKKIADAKGLSFEFMFKADERMYANYPSELRPALEKALRKSGIDWYTEKDKEDAEEYREYWESATRL